MDIRSAIVAGVTFCGILLSSTEAAVAAPVDTSENSCGFVKATVSRLDDRTLLLRAEFVRKTGVALSYDLKVGGENHEFSYPTAYLPVTTGYGYVYVEELKIDTLGPDCPLGSMTLYPPAN